MFNNSNITTEIKSEIIIVNCLTHSVAYIINIFIFIYVFKYVLYIYIFNTYLNTIIIRINRNLKMFTDCARYYIREFWFCVKMTYRYHSSVFRYHIYTYSLNLAIRFRYSNK